MVEYCYPSNMDNQPEGDTIACETAVEVLREIELYREYKKRRLMAFNCLCRPNLKGELTEEQKIAYQNSTCHPLLKEMAKTILEEVEFNRDRRKTSSYFFYFVLFVIFVAVVMFIGLIVWEENKPSKKKYRP